MKAFVEPGRAIPVLIVDDDQDDFELIEDSLKICGKDTSIQWLSYGELVLDYLFQREPFADSSKYPFPSLLFMDIRIPKVNGIEVLKLIKNDSKLKKLPTIILSTSDLSNDVTTAYENGANLYLKKPRGLLELKYFYKAIDTLGLPIVLFP